MISASELEKVFLSCLYKPEELQSPGPDGKTSPPEGAVIVEGIVNNFGFHPGRLEEAKPKVIEMLRELPDQFRETRGGGWSFLNACVTKTGEQWGEHSSMEQLFALGMGLKLVACLMPREMWKMMPGEMPYYQITKEVDEPQETQPS